MPKTTTWILVLGTCALLAIAGCGKDDPVGPENPGGVPDTPSLMENFKKACQNMDYGAYLAVIDPGFRIYLNQATVNEFALPLDYFDYDQDSRIAKNMFSGDAITRPNGDIVPGIVGIEFNAFYPEAAWTPSAPDDRIPDALWAPYRVDIVIHQGSSDLRVEGLIYFYAKAFDVDGVTVYRMVGQVDNTGSYPAKPTEQWSWGTVKALYR